MTKPLVILAAGVAAALAMGTVRAETITEKSGNSTATITQEPGTNMKRKVIKTPNGQTIVQESGNSKSTISQSGGGNSTVIQQSTDDGMDCPDKAKGDAKSKKADDGDCPDL